MTVERSYDAMKMMSLGRHREAGREHQVNNLLHLSTTASELRSLSPVFLDLANYFPTRVVRAAAEMPYLGTHDKTSAAAFVAIAAKYTGIAFSIDGLVHYAGVGIHTFFHTMNLAEAGLVLVHSVLHDSLEDIAKRLEDERKKRPVTQEEINSLFSFSVRRGRLHIVQWFHGVIGASIDCGAKPSPMCTAVDYNNHEVALYLADRGANLREPGLLSKSVAMSDASVALRILRQGFLDVNEIQHAIADVVRYRYGEILVPLCRALPPDVKIPSHVFEDAGSWHVICAAREGRLENLEGHLLTAIDYSSYERVEVLLQCGAPTLRAFHAGYPDPTIVDLVMMYSHDCPLDYDGITAGHQLMGLSRFLQWKDGCSPMQIAAAECRSQLARVMEQHEPGLMNLTSEYLGGPQCVSKPT